jgi:hypothetical protein
VATAARDRLGRSLSIREVDAGSCNGCELEIHALNNAYYDVERFGIRFVASPRHADILLVTGPGAHLCRDAFAQMGCRGRRLRHRWRLLRRQLCGRRWSLVGGAGRSAYSRLSAAADGYPQGLASLARSGGRPMTARSARYVVTR